jgi:hypothetical protein
MKARSLILVALLITFAGLAFAGQTCLTATVIPADGRIVDFDFVANATTNFYQFGATKGHSYSVEVRQDYDDPPSTLTVQVNNEVANCTTAAPNTNSTIATEPTLPANSFRVSYTAAASGSNSISVQNTGVTGRYVSVSVSDTTIFNPQFSTFASFVTQYLFANTTSVPVHGVLTLTATVCAGALPPPVVSNLTIPAGGNLVQTAGPGNSTNISANCTGSATFSHDGPPGSLLPDSLYVNPSATVIVSAKFAATRQGHN